jgi:heavy metal sensor kinase
MSRRSLTFRLVSWYCGLLLALGAAFGAFAYISFDSYVAQTVRSTLDARTDAVWEIAHGQLRDRTALSALMEERFAPEALNRLIRIRDGNTVLYQSGLPNDHGFDPADIRLPDADRAPQFERRHDLFLFAKTYVASDGGKITIEAGHSEVLTETVEERLAMVLAVGLPVLLVIAALGGYILVQRALSPVEHMIKVAEALTFNSPRKRLPLAGTEDRIDALGRALNRMLERLDAAYQHASRFSADAAHELRTPLTIMRGEVELLATEDLPDGMLPAVENIMGETARLSQILESLISLAHMDSVAGKRSHHAVDLKALVSETIENMRLLADEKDISIIPPSGPDVAAAGDRDRLKQVVVNLLDNAIKYTPPGGNVTVEVNRTDDTAELVVRDTGIGIPAESLPQIFDRFYRVATHRGEVGAGLGLAIVRSICAAHGGAVTVDSTPGSGSAFKVTLPLASQLPESIPGAAA